MSPSELSFAAAGLVLAGLVKGVTGIGYATCAMPFLVLSIGFETALSIVVVPALVSNLAVIASSGDMVRTGLRFARFYGALLPGVACGTVLLGSVDPVRATQALAALTIGYVALAVLKPDLALPARLERPLALPAGFLNGVLTGLTGSQIFPLVPYVLALRLDTATQVQTINLAVTITSLALGAALLTTGLATPTLMAVSAAGALPAILGVVAGARLRARLPVAALRRLTLTVLLVIGTSLLARPAFDDAVAVLCPAEPHAPLTGAIERLGTCLARVSGGPDAGSPAAGQALDALPLPQRPALRAHPVRNPEGERGRHE